MLWLPLIEISAAAPVKQPNEYSVLVVPFYQTTMNTTNATALLNCFSQDKRGTPLLSKCPSASNIVLAIDSNNQTSICYADQHPTSCLVTEDNIVYWKDLMSSLDAPVWTMNPITPVEAVLKPTKAWNITAEYAYTISSNVTNTCLTINETSGVYLSSCADSVDQLFFVVDESGLGVVLPKFGNGCANGCCPEPEAEPIENKPCGFSNAFHCGTKYCCSQWNYCGLTESHCGFGCQTAFGVCADPSKEIPGNRCGVDHGDASCGPEYCCSKYGYCGKTEEHCGAGCQDVFGVCDVTPPSDYEGKPCGASNGNVVCGNGYCCSQYGFCGKSQDYCGDGCQSTFGRCVNEPQETLTLPEYDGPPCGIENNGNVCSGTFCCSSYGYCGKSRDYCGPGCQKDYGRCYLFKELR